MRDLRNIITQNVCMAMVRNDVPQEILQEIKSVLMAQLDKCEIQNRCTDLTVVDDTPHRVLEDFLSTKAIEGKSLNTIRRYRYEVSKLLDFFRKPLGDYTTEDIRGYLAYRKKDAISNRTLDGMRKCYSTFFKWITAERIIEWNPCLAVGQIKYRKVIKKPYSAVEMQKLREGCKVKRDIAMIDWFASTGCRVGEVATTRLSDIDWERKSAVVTGKGNKQRTVYMTDICAMHLRQYIDSRRDDCDALFVSRTGKPLGICGLQVAMKKIGKRSGVDGVHCHRFRHSLASFLATKMPITEVALLLGHSDCNTTLRNYITTNEEYVASSYRKAMSV